MSAHQPAPSIVEGLLTLLAPRACPGCDLPMPARQSAWASTGEPSLPTPARPRPVFCDACEPLLEPPGPAFLPPARSAAGWRYQGPLADAIRRFKYGRASELASPLGELLARAARPYMGLIDAVVPIPLHPRKLRERGYNPAALLGRPVARTLGVQQRVSYLARARATGSQAGLSREARHSNVRAAFLAKPSSPTRLLLIDDVRTTGATLAEAARALTAHGHDVVSLTLAYATD